MKTADYLADQAAAMREATLAENVRQTCKALGLLAYHTHDSRRSARGFPDWCIAGPAGLIWRELKAQTGKPTAAQVAWIDALLALGADVDIWRPIDWFSGRIRAELTALTNAKGPLQ